MHREKPDATTKEACNATLRQRACRHNRDRPTETIVKTCFIKILIMREVNGGG